MVISLIKQIWKSWLGFPYTLQSLCFTAVRSAPLPTWLRCVPLYSVAPWLCSRMKSSLYAVAAEVMCISIFTHEMQRARKLETQCGMGCRRLLLMPVWTRKMPGLPPVKAHFLLGTTQPIDRKGLSFREKLRKQQLVLKMEIVPHTPLLIFSLLLSPWGHQDCLEVSLRSSPVWVA